MSADIGVIGLGLMGSNLTLNLTDHKFTVSILNLDQFGGKNVDTFAAEHAQSDHAQYLIPAHDFKEFAMQLKRPRKIVIFVAAGKPVDDLIAQIIDFLEPEDILVDCGNSNYQDTNRRWISLQEKGVRYVGCGVSGGEEGARKGPSLMPGGAKEAWPHLEPIFSAIAARAGNDPCVGWMGDGGAGHYVKMVHNGIEYGDMQLICEAYHFLREALGMSAGEMQTIFQQWQQGPLQSYLIEISGDILGYKDEDGSPLVDKILDTAQQKGTGAWTGISALELGQPLTLIGEAVFARCTSAMKDERVAASQVLHGPAVAHSADTALVKDLEQAVLASKIVSYAQGFMLLRSAARQYKWALNMPAIASVWRAGCIIRSTLLSKFKTAFERDSNLACLLVDADIAQIMNAAQPSWRRVCMAAIERGVPVPGLASALTFFDSYRSARLPANMLQAQRDYFGAHTYERVDRPRGVTFHTQWKQIHDE